MLGFGKRPDNARLEETMETYEFLLRHRTLFLLGPIVSSRTDQFSAIQVMDAIIAMGKDSYAPIHLIIDSPGGEVPTGLALLDTIKLSQAPIYTYCRSAASMAAILMSAGEPGNRFIYPHSRCMIHLPSGVLQGSSKEVNKQNEQMQKIKDMLVCVLQSCGVNKSTKQLLSDMEDEHWMNAQEAVEYGIVDGIVQRGQL